MTVIRRSVNGHSHSVTKNAARAQLLATGTPPRLYYQTRTGLVVQLTHNTATDYGGVYSPDGRWLAFVSDRDGDDEIWVMDAGGGNQTRLTRTAAFVVDHEPAWSPDGRHIALSSNRAGDSNPRSS